MSSSLRIRILINESKTVFWNGPAGYFEHPNFSKGSIKIAKKIADMLNTNYYHTSFSDDLNGVEVSAAIKNIFSMAVGASKG